MKKVSLKDLADYLSLSQTTVSRGLAGYPEVNKLTQKRIRAAAELVNYAPNNAATQLAKGQSNTIGHIIPLSHHRVINPIYADFIAGAGEIYSRFNFDILFSIVPQEKELDAYQNLANSQKVDGFVLSGPKINDERIKFLQQLEIPFLVHGRSLKANEAKKLNYNWVDVNNRQGFFEATSYLISLGHKNIALLNGLKEQNFSVQRENGFRQAMLKNRIKPNNKWILSGEMTEYNGYHLTHELLSKASRPTAILCSSSLMALGVSRALQHKNLVLGKDISVICWDDCISFLNQKDKTMFTSMQSSIFDAGKEVAKIMMELIHNPPQNFHQKMLKAQLVKGESTGRLCF